MKTRFTLLVITAVAGAAALLGPSGARGQAKADASLPPLAGSGRQAILNKLDRIRFDSVHYDGLPLSEVILNLRDETRKRDPEKKGINFLVNPNLDASAAANAGPAAVDPTTGLPVAPAAPTEAPDISAATIKLSPALNDVSLAEALEAIVRVADVPIKYSVAAYGVVFSPRGSEPLRRPETAAATSARQLLTNKLATIRLETVGYAGLPFREVLLNLRDEARKRDPERKGVNFVLSPNLDPDAVTRGPEFDPTTGLPIAPAAPQEPVDISAATIRLSPALNDLSLAEALDAVVRVADVPIKYSIEPYGVVFSLRGSKPARQDDANFTFAGGTPRDFLGAVQEEYNVDWLSVADIPREMADVHIPKLRLSRNPQGLPAGDPRILEQEVTCLVSLYNQLGEQKPELGHLIVREDMLKPSVVMFVPEKGMADTEPKIKVKAFSVYGFSDPERAKLQADIEQAKAEAIRYAARQRGSFSIRNLEGTVALHEGTSLLVATGPATFVEMVESIVTARAKNEPAQKPTTPTPAPPAK